MWHCLTASFVAGLAVGPACFLHCGVFHGAFLARYSGSSPKRNAILGSWLLAGRFAAYMLFGLLVGMAAATEIVTVRQWVLMLILGLLMAGYALVPPRKRSRKCPGASMFRGPGASGGALLLGFTTGLSPCPPFLAAGLIAFNTHGIAAAVLTFGAFFVGSSVMLVPFYIGIAAPAGASRRWIRRWSRAFAGGVAVYAFASAATMQPGASATAESPGISPDAAPGSESGNAEAIATAKGKKEDGAGQAEQLPPPAGKDVEPLFEKKAPTRRFAEKILQRLDLSLKEARWYTPIGAKVVDCGLCPRRCLLEDGQQGMCRTRVNIDGRLRAITYARPVSVAVDPVEKKPLFHVIPGTKALSIATAGCNLGCVFCQNFEISQAAPEEIRRYRVLPEKLVETAVRRGYEGIAYTYTEPTVFYEYMYDTASLAKEKGIKNYWITCGQINSGPLLELCKVIDAANVDLKGFSDEFYVRYCNAHLYPVLDTLKTLKAEGVFTEITNLIVPGGNDDPEMIRSMCRWIVQQLGEETPLHFSRFHPAYKLTKRPATPASVLLEARKIAVEEGLKYVYIGNIRVPGAGDTKCPECGKTVIRRMGYVIVENNLEYGRCEFCGAQVGGIWSRPGE